MCNMEEPSKLDYLGGLKKIIIKMLNTMYLSIPYLVGTVNNVNFVVVCEHVSKNY